MLSTIYIWCFQVESMGRSYAELDEMFMKRIPARKFNTYVSEGQSKAREARGS